MYAPTSVGCIRIWSDRRNTRDGCFNGISRPTTTSYNMTCVRARVCVYVDEMKFDLFGLSKRFNDFETDCVQCGVGGEPGQRENGMETAHTHAHTQSRLYKRALRRQRWKWRPKAPDGPPLHPLSTVSSFLPPIRVLSSPHPTLYMPSAEIALPPRRRGRGGARTRIPRSGDYDAGSDTRRREPHRGRGRWWTLRRLTYLTLDLYDVRSISPGGFD